MEQDIRECPACGIDHQAMDVTPITDERYFSFMCPETGVVVIIDTEEDAMYTLEDDVEEEEDDGD